MDILPYSTVYPLSIGGSPGTEEYSLLFYHLSLRMLEALGIDSILIKAGEQFQRVEDSLVGVILIQRLLSLIDLTHILQKKQTHKVNF